MNVRKIKYENGNGKRIDWLCRIERRLAKLVCLLVYFVERFGWTIAVIYFVERCGWTIVVLALVPCTK